MNFVKICSATIVRTWEQT